MQHHVPAWLSRALLVLLLVSCAACGQLTPRQRLSRALFITGAAVSLGGGAIAFGCVKDDEPGACSGSQGDGTFRIGVPLLAAGAALITSGLMLRPPEKRPSGPAVTRDNRIIYGMQGY
jgi:hypothetical protein